MHESYRHRFDRWAESLPLDQLQLGLKEAEEAEAEAAAPSVRAARVAKRRANRGSLPAHLPQTETVVDTADHKLPVLLDPAVPHR